MSTRNTAVASLRHQPLLVSTPRSRTAGCLSYRPYLLRKTVIYDVLNLSGYRSRPQNTEGAIQTELQSAHPCAGSCHTCSIRRQRHRSQSKDRKWKDTSIPAAGAAMHRSREQQQAAMAGTSAGPYQGTMRPGMLLSPAGVQKASLPL